MVEAAYALKRAIDLPFEEAVRAGREPNFQPHLPRIKKILADYKRTLEAAGRHGWLCGLNRDRLCERLSWFGARISYEGGDIHLAYALAVLGECNARTVANLVKEMATPAVQGAWLRLAEVTTALAKHDSLQPSWRPTVAPEPDPPVASPYIEGNQGKILACLKKLHPNLVHLYTLEVECELCRKTCGEAVRGLMEHGWVSRPAGPRKGIGLTPAGLNLSR